MPETEWPDEGTTQFLMLKGVVCLLDPYGKTTDEHGTTVFTSEEAETWQRCSDAGVMKPFEQALDEFSVWRVGNGYEECEIEGVKVYRNEVEDTIAAVGPDHRSNAAGSVSWNKRIAHIPKLREILDEYKLNEISDKVRELVPESPDSKYKGFRSKYWDIGDSLRLFDRWMRYSQQYTHLEVENARARCTFGKEGALSSILGPLYRKQDKVESRTESRKQGDNATKPWKEMFGESQGAGKPGTNVDTVVAESFTLTIINQDPNKPRMTLEGKDLSYNKQMLDASDPTTILGFARIFYMSLYNEEPTTEWLRNLRANLRLKKLSALFAGYGWMMSYNGKLYEKN